MQKMNRKSIRVAFVSHLSDLTGAPRCLLLILKIIDREYFEPIAICPGHGDLVKKIRDLGIPVIIINKFPPPRCLAVMKNPLYFLLKILYRIFYAVRLFFVFKKSNINVVFLNTLLSSGATIAARLNGLPIITYIHEYIIRFQLTSKIRRWVVLNVAQHTISVSKATQDLAIRYGANYNKTSVIYPSIDEAELITNKSLNIGLIRERWGINQNDIIFGSVGVLIEGKGFLDLINAIPNVLKQIDNCFFVIAGGLPLHKDESDVHFTELMDSVIKLGIEKRVKFLGYMADMSTFYKVIDVLIIPSHEESFSLVAIEGMYMGKPIIASNVGGLKEIINPGVNGILVTPKSPDEFADAMIKLGSEEDLRISMGAAGKKNMEESFSKINFITKIQNIIRLNAKKYN
jgi:glycosyltransferase involved in cell wall biosynthesis